MSASACPARKRFLVSVLLGILFGLLCVYLASQGDSSLMSFKNPIFWSILTDRILIGLAVAMAGAYTKHPVLGFGCAPFFRGTLMGAFFSLPLATGAMTAPTEQYSAWMLFWMTLISGAVYGLIIDVVATKVGGQGKSLLAN